MANKLAGWKEKLLSNAGKEILIKAVAQKVPAYTMSCFKLPNTLCDELTGMVGETVLVGTKEVRKLAWMSWEKMCLTKEEGGMGFKDLKSFNLVLLEKQGWRLQTNTSSLFYRVYKAKYFPGCEFVEANIGRQPSYAWRSIMAAQPLIKRGMRWQVGDGERIKIWRDKWISSPTTYKIITPEQHLSFEPRVKELIDGDSREWKVDFIRQRFLPQDTDAILSIPLCAHGAHARLVWTDNKNGKFSVRSAYRLAHIMYRNGEWAECSESSAVKRI